MHDQIDGQADRQTCMQTDRYTVTRTGISTLHDQTDGQADRKTGRQTWTGIYSQQTHDQRNRHTGRQTGTQ